MFKEKDTLFLQSSVKVPAQPSVNQAHDKYYIETETPEKNALYYKRMG